MRYHVTPARMAKIKNSRNNRCWQGCGEKGTLMHCWWECKLMKPLWKTVWRFLKKLKIELPYDPKTQKIEKKLIQRDACTLMFIAALFTIANIWKQPKCPLVDEWIKMWYIHNGILFIHKKNEILPFTRKWMELESIMLSEISQSEKQIPYDFTHVEFKKQNKERKKR